MTLRVVWKSVIVLSLILFVAVVSPVAANAGQGTVSLTIKNGLGLVQGELTDARLFANGTVSMKMVINSQVDTAYGPFQMTASGVWIGTSNGQQVSGTIENIVGSVGAGGLIVFYGKGAFSGSLTGTNCQGTLTGTLTATSSPVPEVPINQAIPISGTWSADLATS